MSKLLSPRAATRMLRDVGERSALVGGQRVGRARRRQARARARVGRFASVVIVVVLAGAVLFITARWLAMSPRFAVMSVDVRGTSRLAPDRIIDASGVVAGASIFRLRPRQIVQRVESIPGVRHAAVVRELPNRVTIYVEERRAFTLVHGARLHWVDEDGRLLGEERRAVASPLPLITGLTDEELASPGATPSPKARSAIALLRTLLRSGSPLVSEISEIDMSREEGPVLLTVDGIEVHVGIDGWLDRLARLEGVLTQVASEGSRPSMVDLRFRDQVVLRRGGQP